MGPLHTIHYLQNKSSRLRLNRGITTYSETCGIAASIDAREIGAFVEHGGIVVAEGEPVSSTSMIGANAQTGSLSDIFARLVDTRGNGFSFAKGKAI